ncbi:MAG: hypothetical protein K0Q47_4 [Sedimentibacter sp.]|jgi:hypothetical protein|nr:hypothetical protein [Sedimentibacter sp.]
MVKVKNKNNFPLVINLKKGRSVHLPPFGEVEIPDEDSKSPDLLTKIKRKMIEELTSTPQKAEVKEAEESAQFTPKQKIKKEEVDK